MSRIHSWNPRDILKGFVLSAHSVAFSTDGRRFAAGSGGPEAVKLWDTETRQEVLTLGGEGSVFDRLQFSPNGRYLLAINTKAQGRFWSAPTLAEIETAEATDKRDRPR